MDCNVRNDSVAMAYGRLKYGRLVWVGLICCSTLMCTTGNRWRHDSNGTCLPVSSSTRLDQIQLDLLVEAQAIVEEGLKLPSDRLCQQTRAVQLAWYWLEGRKYIHLHQRPAPNLHACSSLASLEQIGLIYLQLAGRHGAKRPQIEVLLFANPVLHDETFIRETISLLLNKSDSYPALHQMVFLQALWPHSSGSAWHMLWLIGLVEHGLLVFDLDKDHFCLELLSWHDVAIGIQQGRDIGSAYAGVLVLGSR